jgi:histidinol-phosphate aminotransferase
MTTRLPFLRQLASLPVYQPGRPIEEVARELGLDPEGIIKLASNENPLGPSPVAIEALRRALPTLHLYPDGNAFCLKRKLAAKLGVNPQNLVLGNGSNEVIELIGHALMEPGTEVVVSQYCFAVYPIVTHLFGASLITVPARDFGHDLPAMRRAITPKTRVVFVANPNNPTGTLASQTDLLELVAAVPAEVLLVLDEAYVEFLPEPLDLIPALLQGRHPNLILLRTFSKIYGLAGLRLGYGIAAPDVIAALEKIRQPFNVNAAAQIAALAALDDDNHVRQTRANNATGLRALEAGCRALGLEFVPSAANFLLVRVGDGARVFAALQQRGVIARPMGGYGLPEWLRVTVGTAAENDRCLVALRDLLPVALP